MAALVAHTAAFGADPGDPVPARYCTDTDQIFWYVLISDTHIGASGSQDADYLKWVVTDAKQVIGPAFTVLGGDITDSTNCDEGECGWFGIPDGPHAEEWQQYRNVLCLDCITPYVDAGSFFDIPGNHDQYSDGNFTYYLANSVQGKATGGTQASWTRTYGFGKYHFLGLNTAANDGKAFSLFFPYGDNAGLDSTELSFIQSELEAHKDAALTILFGHHPLDATGVSGDTWVFYGAPALADLINTHGVSSYSYGHTHRYSEAYFTGGTDYKSGTPYEIDAIDPNRGVFYFNINSLGKAAGNHLTITAIDCNGISSITRDATRSIGGDPAVWPMVLITAPVDIDLGLTDNPFYLGYDVTNSATNPIRALVFDAGPVAGVEFLVDGSGQWQTMTPVQGNVRLWQGTWDASGLAEGRHSIQVQAVRGSYSDTDTIAVWVRQAGNVPPTASFNSSCAGLTCNFTDTSSDSDGSVTAWTWDFGDSATSTEQNPSHTYASGGSFTVTLTVTDDDGAKDSTSKSVTVTAPVTNKPPSASFTSSCTDLKCNFTDTSTDSDGSVTAWSWNFGDGGTSIAQNPSHTYASAGSFTVTLTVTDDDAATGSTSQSVSVSAAAISLTARGYRVKGVQWAELTWSVGSTGTGTTTVYRDKIKVATPDNDGAYDDNIGKKGGGSYTYKVCEGGEGPCSNEATVSF
jgi:PKD repeat protein